MPTTNDHPAVIAMLRSELELLSSRIQDRHDVHIPAVRRRPSCPELQLVLEFVEDHAEALHQVLGSDARGPYASEFRQAIEQGAREWFGFDPTSRTPGTSTAIEAEFIGWALFGVIVGWLDRGIDRSPASMTDELWKLFRGSIGDLDDERSGRAS